MSQAITIADLVAFGVQEQVIWRAGAMEGSGCCLAIRWQTDIGEKGRALLDALEARFGVTWPDGRVCVFASAGAPEQGIVRGVMDAECGEPVVVEVTLFDMNRRAVAPPAVSVEV